jgi:hypothetical protein
MISGGPSFPSGERRAGEQLENYQQLSLALAVSAECEHLRKRNLDYLSVNDVINAGFTTAGDSTVSRGSNVDAKYLRCRLPEQMVQLEGYAEMKRLDSATQRRASRSLTS